MGGLRDLFNQTSRSWSSVAELRWVLLLWTFPGVVVHELAHREACRYYRIPVKETCYFQLADPPGYVVHARPRKYIPAFLISVAPMFVNVFVSVIGGWVFATTLLPFPGWVGVLELPVQGIVGGVLGLWIGVSAGVHALPSRQDASEIWSQTRENWYNPVVLVVVPVVLCLELLNRCRRIHLHIVWGVGLWLTGVYIGVNQEMLISMLIDAIGIRISW